MLELNITIFEKPVAKMRSRKGKYGWYDSQKKEKSILQRLIKEQLFEGFVMASKRTPVEISTKFFFEPTITELKNKKFVEKISNDDCKYTRKPDKDNLEKFLLDAMSGIIFYDDNQVCSGSVEKLYSFSARTEIQIIF